MTRPTLEKARAMYPHRYTMEHVPNWARMPADKGKFYAPQFRTDAEWYAATLFPGDAGHHGFKDSCMTDAQTWPLGQWLDAPYRIER